MYNMGSRGITKVISFLEAVKFTNSAFTGTVLQRCLADNALMDSRGVTGAIVHAYLDGAIDGFFDWVLGMIATNTCRGWTHVFNPCLPYACACRED